MRLSSLAGDQCPLLVASNHGAAIRESIARVRESGEKTFMSLDTYAAHGDSKTVGRPSRLATLVDFADASLLTHGGVSGSASSWIIDIPATKRNMLADRLIGPLIASQ
jgi:hypothetical protein